MVILTALSCESSSLNVISIWVLHFRDRLFTVEAYITLKVSVITFKNRDLSISFWPGFQEFYLDINRKELSFDNTLMNTIKLNFDSPTCPLANSTFIT